MRRLCVFFFVTLSAWTQEPAVRLRLSTVSGQTQFHIGQPITVTLTFETAGAANIQL